MFLLNGEKDVRVTSKVERPSGTAAFCPENTMASDAQLNGAMTKVIFKGRYVPAETIDWPKGGSTSKPLEGLDKDLNQLNQSYFWEFDKFYTIQYMQYTCEKYPTSATAKDMKKFLIGAGLIASDATEEKFLSALAGLTEVSDPSDLDPTKLNAESGIRARNSGSGIRFYYKGMCYYEVAIRHDIRVGDRENLGYFGVVRNNGYQLKLNSVSKLGTPWIPGGPEDPLTPPEKPDELHLKFNLTIETKPWVFWYYEEQI